jgi:hypothetical protein
MMIDNFDHAMELINKIKENIPIPVIPSKETLNTIRQNNITIPDNYQFQIEGVMYMGDMGGIGCAISVPDGSESAFIVSLTHLRILAGHPLAKEIKYYQRKRTKKLAKSQG